MCGIAGVVHPDETIALAAVQRMNQAQAHRGPDDAGTQAFRAGGRSVVLGHRRLSIQDTSLAGHQPMVNPLTGDAIVYNGELYNVVELRNELASHGATFRGGSDTEVALLAFGRWGRGCVERFRGMFAFAVYAPRDRKVHLVRDPLGIKPLYFARTREGFLFASELRAVLASGFIERRIDRGGLASLLAYGAVAAPRTMIEGVRLVDAATWLEIDLAGPCEEHSHTYWRFPTAATAERTPALVGAMLREPLESAVASHLLSDVPVGVFLSSGIDSTAIAVLAAEARGGDVDTFTVALANDPNLDEGRLAAQTASQIGARHHNITVGEAEAVHLARAWRASLDQPTVDGLNTFIISRAVRDRGIVVALSGVGGDEMFGGYTSFRQVPALHRAIRAVRWLPRSGRRALAQRLTAGLGATRSSKAGDFAASDGSLLELYLLRRQLFSHEAMQRFGFEGRAWRDAHFLPPEAAVHQWVHDGDDWASVRALETKLYMANVLLRDADVFGMAHGLEIRVPLLDRRVVEGALTWSRNALNPLLSGNKPWIRAALGQRLPRHVRRLSKRGFSLPYARWMRGALRAEVESGISEFAKAGVVEGRVVVETWEDFLRTESGPAWSRAWLLSTLGTWFNNLGELAAPLSAPAPPSTVATAEGPQRVSVDP